MSGPVSRVFLRKKIWIKISREFLFSSKFLLQKEFLFRKISFQTFLFVFTGFKPILQLKFLLIKIPNLFPQYFFLHPQVSRISTHFIHFMLNKNRSYSKGCASIQEIRIYGINNVCRYYMMKILTSSCKSHFGNNMNEQV